MASNRRQRQKLERDAIAWLIGTRQGRQVAAVLLVVLVVAAIAYGIVDWLNQHHVGISPTVATSVSDVRIATWNLRFFSGSRKIPPDLAKITQIITANHFHV